MPTLTKYVPQSESELHLIIQRELDALEDGMVLLQHEYPTGSGPVDFLCVDAGRRLVTIEVKLHEDENVLLQALRYYSAIEKDRFLVANAFKEQGVDPQPDPRVVIIAEAFSDDVKRLATLVVPDVELYEYTVVVDRQGEKGIIFHSVSLPVAEKPATEPATIEKLIEYLRGDALKPTLAAMRHAIKSIGGGIEEYATTGYIGYKHSRGRQFAYIRVNRTSLEIGAHLIDEKHALLGYDDTRVQSPDDNYAATLEKIKASYQNLGGRLVE